jgi:hypothetical protein
MSRPSLSLALAAIAHVSSDGGSPAGACHFIPKSCLADLGPSLALVLRGRSSKQGVGQA